MFSETVAVIFHFILNNSDAKRGLPQWETSQSVDKVNFKKYFAIFNK